MSQICLVPVIASDPVEVRNDVEALESEKNRALLELPIIHLEPDEVQTGILYVVAVVPLAVADG